MRNFYNLKKGDKFYRLLPSYQIEELTFKSLRNNDLRFYDSQHAEKVIYMFVYYGSPKFMNFYIDKLTCLKEIIERLESQIKNEKKIFIMGKRYFYSAETGDIRNKCLKGLIKVKKDISELRHKQIIIEKEINKLTVK